MNPDEYLSERVEGQIDWHERKSKWNQVWHKRLQILVIIGGALLPFFAGLGALGGVDLRYIVGGLGVVIAVLTGLQGSLRFQELWIEYRVIAESLRHEQLRFACGVTPYDVADPFPSLFERVESILSEGTSSWQGVQKAAAEQAAET